MNLQGADVSNHQGPSIDWTEMARDLQFVGIKATEGASFVDPYFDRNWNMAKANGLVRIAYHFARPSANSAVVEAKHFSDTVRSISWEPGDLLALDMEDTDMAPKTDLLPWTDRFCSEIESMMGVIPGLYSGWWFMQPHGLYANPAVTRMWLWLASWGDNWPMTPPGWDKVTIWQKTDRGTAGGITPLDLDEFEGTQDDLRDLGLDGGINALEELAKGWHVAELLDSISAHDLANAQRSLLLRLKKKGGWG